NASCTTSSASARLCMPNTRTSADTMRPASRRKRSSSSSTNLAYLHHRPYFHDPADIENRAAGRQLNRVADVSRLDQGVAAPDILRLSERTIGDRLVLSCDELPGPFERVAWVLDVSVRRQRLQPVHPPLQLPLHLGRRSGRALSAAIKKNELTHCLLL